LVFDVSGTGVTKAAFEYIARDRDRLDSLINDAGVIPRKLLLETTNANWTASPAPSLS